MRSPLLLLALLAPAPVARDGPQDVPTLSVEGVRDVTREGNAFLEISTDRGTYFVHERVRVRLRFGFAGRFLEDHMLQLFRRSLDVPVQIQASWMDRLQDTGEPPDPARPTLAFGDELATARRLGPEAGAEHPGFTVLELVRTFRVREPGEIVLTPAVLRFAFATEFADDLVRGRVPVDRSDALVRSSTVTLRIQPLPEEGRPLGFTGAVGSFTVTASAAPRELTVGESLTLTLRIDGDGSLTEFALPRIQLPGFRVQGILETEAASGRAFVADVVPLDERVRSIPAVSFSVFDPTPPADYRTVATAPVPILVRPARPSLPDDAGPDLEPRHDGVLDEPESSAPASPSGGILGLVAGALAVLVLLLVLVRARRSRGADPLPARVGAAAAAFRGAATAAGADPEALLTGFLATVLECPAAAVIGRDLHARLARVGLPEELGRRSEAVLDAMHEARYGGRPEEPGAQADGLDQATRLVAELEAVLGRRGRS